VSRERARRRAEREAAAALERARRARARARRDRVHRWRRAALGPLARPFRPARGSRRPDSVLLRRRRRQNGLVLAVLLACHTVLWLLQPSWLWRGSALVLSVLAWPALIVLLFDRRSSG